jgi:hypothetical protein
MKLCENQPLYLPKGSIRALLALITVISAIYLLAIGKIGVQEFGVIVGAIIAFYFTNRAKDDGREEENCSE